MISCALCAFLWLFFLLDRGYLHLGTVLNCEVDAVVDGDAVQKVRVCHRKLHLHRGHESLDVSVIDLDRRSLRIQALHDSNTMIRI